MTYLVHGATGAQGSPVVAALLAAGSSVTALSRDGAPVPGAASAPVDYASVDSLTAAYDGADGVFVHLPLGPPDLVLPYARNVAAAVARARPSRVVVSTSGGVVDAPGDPLQQPADAPLPVLLAGLAASGISYAVTAPRLFLENLLLPPVIEGVRADGVLRYPVRTDFAVSWASHLDVADAAAALLLRTDVSGVVGVGQLPGITGTDLAAAFTEHLGREVEFEQITPARFGELIVPLVGEAAAAGVVALYDALWAQPSSLIGESGSAQHRLELAPRTTTAWLTDVGV